MPSSDKQVKESLDEILHLFKKYVAGTLEEANVAKLTQMLTRLPSETLAQVYQAGGVNLEKTLEQQQNPAHTLQQQPPHEQTKNPLNPTPMAPTPEENSSVLQNQRTELNPTQNPGLTDQQKLQKKPIPFAAEDDDNDRPMDVAQLNAQSRAAQQSPTLNRPIPQQSRSASAPTPPQQANAARDMRQAAQFANSRQPNIRRSIINQDAMRRGAIARGVNTHVTNLTQGVNKHITNLKIDANEDRTNQKLDTMEAQSNLAIDSAEARSNRAMDQNKLANKKQADHKNEVKETQTEIAELDMTAEAPTAEPQVRETRHHALPTPFKMVPKPFDPSSF